MLILLGINIFYIPLNICFFQPLKIEPNQFIKAMCSILPSWAFIMDVLLKFFTAYYEKGILVNDRKQIFLNYLRKESLWDLIVLVPYFLA